MGELSYKQILHVGYTEMLLLYLQGMNIAYLESKCILVDTERDDNIRTVLFHYHLSSYVSCKLLSYG